MTYHQFVAFHNTVPDYDVLCDTCRCFPGDMILGAHCPFTNYIFTIGLIEGVLPRSCRCAEGPPPPYSP